MYDTSLERLLGREYKIMKKLLDAPKKEWTLPIVAKAAGLPKMSVYRSLERMSKEGFLARSGDGYRKYYRVKQSYLMRSLGILRNLDSPVIEDLLARFGRKSSLVLLFGSRAQGTNDENSDWDILIVSDTLNAVEMNPFISRLEKRTGSQINVKTYTENGFKELVNEAGPFYNEVRRSSYVLKGDISEYR